MTAIGIHTTSHGAHICFQTIVLCGRNFASSYDINRLRIGCFYATCCGQAKHAVCVKVCSVPTAFASGHRTVLMLSSNIRFSVGVWAGIVGDSRSSLPATWQAVSSAISWEPFFQGCLEMCLNLWNRVCDCIMRELQRMSYNGWTRHILEGEYDIKNVCMASSVIGSAYDGWSAQGAFQATVTTVDLNILISFLQNTLGPTALMWMVAASNSYCNSNLPLPHSIIWFHNLYHLKVMCILKAKRGSIYDVGGSERIAFHSMYLIYM